MGQRAMRQSLGDKPSRKANTPPEDAVVVDVKASFSLEDQFPVATNLFQPYFVSLKGSNDTLVSIDTNALLLPYSIGTGDLRAIGGVYRALAGEQRLFGSARVVREFIRRRDQKLAEMIKALGDGNSRLTIPDTSFSFFSTAYLDILKW